MTMRGPLARIGRIDGLNFLLTNAIPRRLATLLMGRISRIESEWFTAVGIAVWKLFCDLDLSESKAQRFRSLQECFTRELAPGARPIDADPAVLASPCDAIVGAVGRIECGTLLQAKGSTYRLADLLQDSSTAERLEGGYFVTLRLTAGMYHRFHAPQDCVIEQIDYVAGDAWNVNPPTLARMERLFCRNERAVLRLRLADGARINLVPVAAVLVASIRFTFLDVRLHLRYRGPNRIPCDARLSKGDSMGWFEHGSTIIVLVPRGFVPPANLRSGARIRAGEALLRSVESERR
ncbi:MAG: phosphatidylserine decarboxylase [Gammaproteobacteria bacterium]|nr:phosphatidylserine decarboxylase [Gammaproteobacteria bacterium]